MLKAYYKQFILRFKQASGTSRGVLRTKETFFIKLTDDDKVGYGECGLFRGLSIDDVSNYEAKLDWVCSNISLGLEVLLHELKEYPSIQFGLEQAFLSLRSDNPFELFSSKFIKDEQGIAINGLIWMGDKKFMKDQIADKLKQGFKCLKMKIGAIDFDSELSLLASIRKEYDANDIELRVDANGAFGYHDALEKLKRLSDFDLHSIEQPIAKGQLHEMASLCENTPLPIALDEELIGVFNIEDKELLLETIKPQYIILKPSLVGGAKGTKEFISCASRVGADWWITSALESNVGLNAIAQLTYALESNLPQGLGTGSLFTNNIESPLYVANGYLKYDFGTQWNIEF